MTARILITRAGPLATIQDTGRFGMLAHGVSASGPMDRAAYANAGHLLGASPAGAIEITMAGLEFRVDDGACMLGFAGGVFSACHNDKPIAWPGTQRLLAGDTVSISPGPSGNYGYLRFDLGMDVPSVMGSLATNSRAQIGGFEGRALRRGDRLRLLAAEPEMNPQLKAPADGPIRVVWGLHADLFPTVRNRFLTSNFTISASMDRMGVRLADIEAVFTGSTILSLVSDAVVPGDIQILGDGTPIVLMRDHQPTGGYPRIATIIAADLDRFAQLRPGKPVAFTSVDVDHAHQLARGGGVTSIDLNADLGEGMGTDDDLLQIVSSASIACGGHAGDAPTIRRILRVCKAQGVRAGAHPGYADPKRFGRFRVDMPRAQLLRQIRSQLLLSRYIADEVGVPLAYVKLHGALANQTAEDLAFALDIFAAAQAMDAQMAVLALDNSQQVQAARALRMPLIREAYADRAYTANGMLVPRSQADAVIHDTDAVIARCLLLAKSGEIVAIDGSVFRSTARSICLHGDTPGAVDLARAIRDALEREGVTIAAEAAEAPI